jgi:hypothetical protein
MSNEWMYILLSAFISSVITILGVYNIAYRQGYDHGFTECECGCKRRRGKQL